MVNYSRFEKEYNHSGIEKKWQKIWEENKIFESKEELGKEKYYCLEMLPYPSGNLHMGHVRNYGIGDVFARFYRMRGKNVLHPIGWDAFGLPAENAAIKNKIHPAEWTRQNIANMRWQLKTLGISYDWARELATCDPKYYKWNQWLFIKMWEKGLVFRKNADVNWCPSCNTVLANEQVLNGACWRCDSRIEHKNLEQWFVKITAYADELLESGKRLCGWPEQVLSMQTSWIGKSFGIEIDFALSGISGKLRVFTTRPDTVFGASFMVVAPEHEIINRLKSGIANYDEVMKYVLESRRKSNIERSSGKEKTGVKLEGVSAINPATGNKIPIFVSDYILTNYGTGIIMAVPAHDQRDWEFAKKYNVPILEVVKGENSSVDECAYESEGTLINSKQFNGVKSREAFNVISQWIEKQRIGKRTVKFKLKDWLVSRQRYWGTPIPMVYCKKCGAAPVLQKDLPVTLPEDILFAAEGESPLKSNECFINTKCPKCGMPAKRETDTMDTFIDSSWYYARYCDPSNGSVPFDSAKVNYWMPVDRYVGGIEHACMHLIYSRFWHKVMRDLGLVRYDEPFKNLLTQGMVVLGSSAMSKSRGNIVSSDEIVSKYGADTARLFILFAAPPQKQLNWSSEGVQGCWRFINRVWRLFNIVREKSEIRASEEDKAAILRIMHRTVKKVTDDIEKESSFNTAISSLMELVNVLYSYKYHSNDDGVSLEVYKTAILLMSPFTPHVCEEIWEMLGGKDCISVHIWPSYDENMIRRSTVELPVQINGKVKGKIIVSAEADDDNVKQALLSNEKILPYFKDKQILKFIYVKGKIVSILLN